jgi:DNA helicase-2/ATP-dependent DNA helicase PcrA
VLAWVRLLVDPQDAAAVVRALTRPPIELPQAELARVIQLVRRRKLDLVSGLAGATESPRVPPEARERIQRFLELHRCAAAWLDIAQPEAFLDNLIEHLGMRVRPLLAPEAALEQQASLASLRELAAEMIRRDPNSTSRALARRLAMIVAVRREGGGEDRLAPELGLAHRRDAEHSDPRNAEEQLEAALQRLREEVLASVGRIGGRLGELRLDTDLDISHGVVRYLELLKLAALLQRPAGQGVVEALSDINSRLLAATTPVQREIFQTSTLDEALAGASEAPDRPGSRAEQRSPRGDAPGSGDGRALSGRAMARAIAPRGEPSLRPFLPHKGIGLALSASDIETYRACPLRYKFARVMRIPTEQTLHQRFGIAVHQVLERYHSERGESLGRMLALLEAGWRRAGLGDGEHERRLHGKAREALTRYHARLERHDAQPVWFERPFAFRLGQHHLRGRVDRVDRLGREGDGEYELIDYKTSRPKSAAQLRDDVQLSIYALAAREAWQLRSSRQAYHYVLDDRVVPLPVGEREADAVRDTVLGVGEAILAERFDPTPSQAVCSMCDYRIICPAAER